MLGFGVFVLLVASASALPFDSFIVGGENAEAGRFPYQISIQWEIVGIKQHICGGTIISPDWVVTAGHCITEVPQFGTFYVRAGVLKLTDADKQEIEVSEKIVHPDYSGGVAPNDIALLRLKTPLVFSDTVGAAKLPAADAIPLGESTLSGWGSTSSTNFPIMPNTLQTAELPIIPYDECAEAVKLINNGEVEPLASTNVCTGPLTGGFSACSGDSGGPLTQDDVLIGIVSWGWMPCGSVGAPSVYTMVSQYISWINKHTNV